MYKSWLEALKTPFWYRQRGAFPIFSKNAVEVEAVPQQVVEQGAFKQKNPSFPWHFMHVKPLHDFKKAAEPINRRKKSTVGT